MPKILLVEDDSTVSSTVSESLQAERHVVDIADNVRFADEMLQAYTYDLIILDWQLPDGAGVDLCARLRTKRVLTPILMLTGKDAVHDKIEGLESGADDYLTKPFALSELSARVRALLRRGSEKTTNAAGFADISVDEKARSAAVRNSDLKLTPREFALLNYFICHPQELLSHDELRNRVWWDEPDVMRNTVNASVARLRKKLEEAGSGVSITAVVGEGFRIEGG